MSTLPYLLELHIDFPDPYLTAIPSAGTKKPHESINVFSIQAKRSEVFEPKSASPKRRSLTKANSAGGNQFSLFFFGIVVSVSLFWQFSAHVQHIFAAQTTLYDVLGREDPTITRLVWYHTVYKNKKNKRSRSCEGCFHLGSRDSLFCLPLSLSLLLFCPHLSFCLSRPSISHPFHSFMSDWGPAPKLVYIIFGMPTSGRPMAHAALRRCCWAYLLSHCRTGFYDASGTSPHLWLRGFYARHLAKCVLSVSLSL